MSKSLRQIKPGVCVNVYDVLDAFDVTDQALGHAIKKLLCTGEGGAKDFEQDANEAIQSIACALQIHKRKKESVPEYWLQVNESQAKAIAAMITPRFILPARAIEQAPGQADFQAAWPFIKAAIIARNGTHELGFSHLYELFKWLFDSSALHWVKVKRYRKMLSLELNLSKFESSSKALLVKFMKKGHEK